MSVSLKIKISIASLVFLSFSARAQNEILIEGLVVDKKSNSPIEFSHIGIVGTNIGTITNSKGEFKIHVNDGGNSNSFVAISHLGYDRLELRLSDAALMNKFEIVPTTITLDEVVIGQENLSIVEEAVAKIPENYDFEKMALECFWRAALHDQKDVVQLSETAFEIIRAADRKDQSFLKIKKGRISRDSAALDKVFNIQAGIGPKGLFKTSFLKDHPILSKKVLKNHSYELVDVTTFNGRAVYVIDFDYTRVSKKGGYEGRMLIDTKTLAFIQITYDLSSKREEDPDLFNDTSLGAVMLGLGASKIHKSETSLNFHEVSGKWYLSHAHYDAAWTIIQKKSATIAPMTYQADFIVTDVRKNDVIVPQKEDQAQNKILEKQLTGSSEDFWTGITHLLPDQDFDLMFDEIERRNLRWRRSQSR